MNPAEIDSWVSDAAKAFAAAADLDSLKSKRNSYQNYSDKEKKLKMLDQIEKSKISISLFIAILEKFIRDGFSYSESFDTNEVIPEAAKCSKFTDPVDKFIRWLQNYMFWKQKNTI
jgi:hypothetical protein